MKQTTSLLQHGKAVGSGLIIRSCNLAVLIVGLMVCATAGAAEPVKPPADQAAPVPSRTFPAKPLDLRAPDITKLYSAAELERMLSNAKDRDMDEIEVEGLRAVELLPLNTPKVLPGLLAPFWAIAHPTQAWRIFAPIPSDQ